MGIDKKEFELPDTVFSRDIDSQVFQNIVVECLSKVEGIKLASGSLIDSFLTREESASLNAIHVEQDARAHTVNLRIELAIAYGTLIPAKAEEIQSLVALEITRLTGLHVGSVHVVVKSLFFPGKVGIASVKKEAQPSEYSAKW